jgi:hypothetical protein
MWPEGAHSSPQQASRSASLVLCDLALRHGLPLGDAYFDGLITSDPSLSRPGLSYGTDGASAISTFGPALALPDAAELLTNGETVQRARPHVIGHRSFA